MSENVASGNCYLYVLDTLADWEIGYITAELRSRRFTAANWNYGLSCVGADCTPVVSMGGMHITPEKSIAEVEFKAGDLLILPGADRWGDEEHGEVVKRIPQLLDAGVIVAAICGATVALAQAGLLNTRNHTSNDKAFLAMMCPEYSGGSHYIDAPAVVSEGLITASGLAPLEFAYEIFKTIGAMHADAAEAWYQLYRTRESKYFFALMEAVKPQEAAV